MTPARVDVLGVPVDCVTAPSALQAAEAMLADDRPHVVLAVNPEKIMKARHDPEVRGDLARASLLLPDGIGVVWAVRLLHRGRLERVPGSEFMPSLCEVAVRLGRRVFLFGGAPEVNRRAARVLTARYPGLSLAGAEHGYLDEKAMSGLVRRINESGADILFVALGSPKQERWITEHLPSLRVKICQGVGGTFDVLAGKVRRAPRPLRACHLEWLYRLASEPTRLRRQAALPRFAALVLRELVAR